MALFEAQTQKPIIDLSGEGGNVFSLIGLANRYSKVLELDTKEIIKEMISGDYGNAVFVFNREFGEFFDVHLPPKLTIASIEQSRAKYEKAIKMKNAAQNPDVMVEAYLR